MGILALSPSEHYGKDNMRWLKWPTEVKLLAHSKQSVGTLTVVTSSGSGKSPGEGNENPLPVFLPGEFHGQRSLAGYSPWGCKELDMIEWLAFGASQLALVVKNPAGNVGDGGSIPGLVRSQATSRKWQPLLQYSCLENSWTEEPGGEEDRWVHGAAESGTTKNICIYTHTHRLFITSLEMPDVLP